VAHHNNSVSTLHTANYKLHTTHYELRTTDYKLRTYLHYQNKEQYELRLHLRIMLYRKYKLQNTHYKLQTTNYTLHTTNYTLQTAKYT